MGCRSSRPTCHKGEAILLLGPMFARKTTTMIDALHECERNGLRILFVKPHMDTRSGGVTLVTHDNVRVSSPVIKCVRLSELLDAKYDDIDVFGIDEVHFFEDAPQVIAQLTAKGRRIWATGLNGWYDRQMPDVVSALIGQGAIVQPLFATCVVCGSKTATLSVLRERGRPSDTARQPLIGGADKYFASCVPCHSRADQKALL